MKRREFVEALAAVSLAGRPSGRAVRRTRLDRIGLELYSVRDAMRADPEKTLAAVRDIGYGDVELLWSFGNFGRTPAQVRDTLRSLKLRAPSAHIAPETLLTDWQRSLDTAVYLGHQYLIVPSLPAETNRSLEQWRLWTDRFNTAGQAARKSGIWLAFHNEPEHQHPVDGQIPYDLFIQGSDPRYVRLQLDVGNMLVGGGDPQAYLEAHADRYWSFHLKDVTANHAHDTELGAGVFDFRKFLAAIRNLDQKPCYVEQEAATDPMASARSDYRYLRDLTF
jgi:sugar phosphate isomerase/epimerase